MFNSQKVNSIALKKLNMKIDSIRDEYKYAALNKAGVANNPIEQFKIWLDEALKSDIPHPTAMSISSIGTDGFPQTRIVLLKFVDASGFVFFTNYNSDKVKAIENNYRTGLHFFWPQLERQVRIIGFATKTPAVISDEYFNNRPRNSQLAAWASNQSSEIASRKYLEKQFEKFDTKYKDTKIPRPEFWGGINVKPIKVEFWQGRESRLHDRILYEFNDQQWTVKRLAP